MRAHRWRTRLTAGLVSGSLLAGTLAAAPIAHAAVPVDEAGLANALFGSTMRIANRDDDLAKNLVASAELLDWRAKNPAAAPAAVTAHFAAVRKHIEAAVPNQAWSRESVESVGAALAAVRTAPGVTIAGPQLNRMNNTMQSLDTAPVDIKPEDRVSGERQQLAWEEGYAETQAQVWNAVARTARADAGFKAAWNAGAGDRVRVNAGGSATEFAQSERLREVLDVSKLQNAAKLGTVELRKEADTQLGTLITRLYNNRKDLVDGVVASAGQNPPDAKPAEPTEAQKAAAKEAEEKRKGYIDGAKAGIDGLAWVVSLVDKDFAKRITKFGEGAVKVAYAVNKAVTAFTLINSAFSLATAAFTGNVIGAIGTLISVFTAGGPSVEKQILDEIKAMREQLERMQAVMNDRFSKVDAKLDKIYDRMLEEFRKLENDVAWVRQNTVQILSQLTSLSTELQVVGSTLLKAISGLRLLKKWEDIGYYIDYARKHPGSVLSKIDFEKAENAFWVNAVQEPTSDLFIVPQGNHKTDPATVLTNLNLHGDGGAAGFLAFYANAALGAGLSTTGAGGNASVWGIGATSYGLLLKQNPALALEMSTTGQRGKAVLDEGRAIRDQLLAFSQPGPNGATNKIFQNLLANYGAKADQLVAEVARREGEVSEGKQLSLFRGPEQGAPAGTQSLYGPAEIEPCTKDSDPAKNVTISRPKNHDGQHMTAPTQFYRYFRGDKFTYRPCWGHTARNVAGQPNAFDFVIQIRDEFIFPGAQPGTEIRWSSKATEAAVFRGTHGQGGDARTLVKENWAAKFKPIFERDGRVENGVDFLTPRFAEKGEEVLREKRLDFYPRAATFVRDSQEARELNLAARLLRAYTEAGFPRALGTDEYLRSALFGAKPLYGAGQDNNQFLADEYTLAFNRLQANQSPWDPARSDRQLDCAGAAARAGKDPIGGCLRENMKSRQDRLTDRITEQFKQRWEGADQTLPGLQTQLRTLWLTLRSLHPDFDFGPPIEAPAPPAPAAGIWNQPEPVDSTANVQSGVATTVFKGQKFVAWRGTDGYLYGSLFDGKQWAPKTRIIDKQVPADSAPSVTEFNGRLVLVWKYKLFVRTMEFAAVSSDGRTWSNTATNTDTLPQPLRHTDSPALTGFNGLLYALYRGTDQQLYLRTSADGSNWNAPELTLAGNMTNQRPGMTAHNGRLFVAWRGHDQHPRAYMASSADGVNWTPAESRVGGLEAAIDGGPVLASHGGKLYAVWRGGWGDPAMYGSFTTDGKQWSPHYPVARTAQTWQPPAVTVLDGRLQLAWGPPSNAGAVFTASSAVLPG